MENTATLLVFHSDEGSPTRANEIKEALEGKDVSAKVEAMKKAIMLLNNNGESLPQLFITIVRYVLPLEDHTVQKLLLLYLEIIDRTDSKGRLLPEMILICQNLHNNLKHPNEYIRGVTLRFLCRVSESEIIEPLVPSVLSNLDHRHPFVRRNTILVIMSIYNNLPHLLAAADAAEMMEKALGTELDPLAKRNAFLMLFNCCDRTRAMNYLLSNVDLVPEWSEPMQMMALDSIRRVCGSNPDEKGKYIVIIVSLLTDTSAAVMYECAGMLVPLSSAPTAIRSAAATYCQLLLSQSSDNNVKLIILDRLKELTSSHREVMAMGDAMIMDVLRALSIPNLDIRRKTLEIVPELITPRNMGAVLQKLKEELVETVFWQSRQMLKNVDYLRTLSYECRMSLSRPYKHMLKDAIDSCEDKCPEASSSVGCLYMEISLIYRAELDKMLKSPKS